MLLNRTIRISTVSLPLIAFAYAALRFLFLNSRAIHKLFYTISKMLLQTSASFNYHPSKFCGLHEYVGALGLGGLCSFF